MKVDNIDNKIELFRYYCEHLFKYPSTFNFLKQSFDIIDYNIALPILKSFYV